MSMLDASSIPTGDFFFLTIFSQFSRLSRNEKGEHYFIVYSDVLYIALFIHNTCTLNFYTKKAQNSAAGKLCFS